MGCYFITCINELHQIYTNLNIHHENVILEISMNLQLAFIAFFKTVLIIWSCCRVYKQVDILISLIHDINNKSFNFNLNDQLRWFSMHLRYEKIFYRPCKLFTLDIKFLGKVMLGIVSYLLILIQFDRATET
ncbi:uncharacterized protein LOC108734461 [Agrilus planipennis]|uniref:Uncharacterized protein LOC108734461 n=1 Tax=Agrilus planipennis TaxID=224129 RepID=A0A7F5R0H4_AGRPL|nr:uncharacterized protein LOC108734461 [Agrilus planipennis]